MKHEISSVQDVLEVQAKLMSSWPGTALDNLGLIRIVNADGRQAPFFWIFNADAVVGKRLAHSGLSVICGSSLCNAG